LLAAGWLTAYEPRALVGMQVPTSLGALWAQRKRWARGQGEVLRTHLGEVLQWRNHQMWLMGAEAVASLVWVIALVVALAIAVLKLVIDPSPVPGIGLSWGVAICAVATVQVTAALLIEAPYDPRNWRVPGRAALPGVLLANLGGSNPTL
jgi:biofilm PGA synthesis N-glycosyltransferase PgaC